VIRRHARRSPHPARSREPIAPWPERPRAARDEAAPDEAARGRGTRPPRIADGRWPELAPLLEGRWASGAALRDLAEASLWVLRTGKDWRALPARFPSLRAARRAWRAWLADGRWVTFWSAYVAGLSADERRAWLRALAHGGERLRSGARPAEETARAAWWLVSVRLLSAASARAPRRG
jgi:hypothetical protein